MDPFWVGVLQTFVGVLFGGVINWWFAREGSAELKSEAAELRRLNNVLISALEVSKVIRIARDEKGLVKGIEIIGEATLGMAGLTAQGTGVTQRRAATTGSVGATSTSTGIAGPAREATDQAESSPT